MEITLRRCGPDDLPALCDISRSTYYETFARANTPENMKAYLEQAYSEDKLRRELADGHSEFYFAYVDGELAGYLKVNECPAQSDIQDPESLEVERLYVAGAFQDRGLGGVFMKKAVELAVARKKSYVWLGVWEHNHKAQAFYQKHGFYRIGAHPFVMGDDAQTDLVLRRDL